MNENTYIEDIAALIVGKIYWLGTEAQRKIYDEIGKLVEIRNGDYAQAEVEMLLLMKEVLDQ